MASVLMVGFGKLAQQLATQLSNDFELAGVKRTTLTQDHNLPSSLSMHYLDLNDATTLTSLPTDFDFAVITLSPDAMTDDAYHQTYVKGVHHLLEHFKSVHANTRFIYVSSTRVYGQNSGEWVDEQSETLPTSIKGKCLLEAENLVLSHSLNNCVVRFSGIYNHKRTRFFKRVQQGVELQKLPPYYSNRIHQDDCVGIICFLLQKMKANQPLDPIYLCSDHSPTPQFEVAEWIANRFDFPSPKASSNHSSNSDSSNNFSTDSFLTKNQGKRCDSSRIRQLGYQFKFPSFQQGYAELPNEK
ncbi:sugar nucleotide-binding protein [Pleionea mediterranea]|uniref:Nucleoside-diphosphate-sugar epimerase n=1 Tax=Pleionea mediterranea TaxID=523701 RepID=A0A316FC97_9GAMM|nr:sugar nucleotide-binding protein [Pleionea mediterranea]PWK43601.1 nucleoside-diphosphate-sugar epimerase [Pleionea mediterranea]